MDTKTKLKKRIARKKKQLSKLRKRIRTKERMLKSTKRYKTILAMASKVEKEITRLDKKERKVIEDIRFEFTNDGNRPYYSRNDMYRSGIQTNIDWKVLNAIKKKFRISRLRGSDIEEIVERLIHIEEGKTELPKLRLEISKVRKIRDKLNDKRWKLENTTHKLNSKAWEIERNINELNNTLKQPPKIVKREERKTERDKVNSSETIREVYNIIRSDENAS